MANTSTEKIEFSTQLVEFSSNKWVRLLLVVVFLLLIGIIIAYFLEAFTVVTALFGAGALLVIIFAVAMKGQIQVYGLSEKKLIITTGSISIGDTTYEIQNIRHLLFAIHSYSGMNYKGGGYTTEVSSGMKNEIYFQSGTKKVQYNFYLNSAAHVGLLCAVFKEFYIRHIPFIEKDMYDHQTYLLKNLTP